MKEDNQETLWEHIESYDAGDSTWGNIKTYTVLALYFGFFFICLPFGIALPLANGLGLTEWQYIFYIPIVIIVWLAGKSIKFQKRNIGDKDKY